MRTQKGRRVCFVADPKEANADDCVYARPDDPSDLGPSWRELLNRYDKAEDGNPLSILGHELRCTKFVSRSSGRNYPTNGVSMAA
jgi:hypothetical protein